MGERGFGFENNGKATLLDKHIDTIADCLGATIDYLDRGKEIKTDALPSQEMDLVEGFRCLTDEARDVMLKNVRLLACV